MMRVLASLLLLALLVVPSLPLHLRALARPASKQCTTRATARAADLGGTDEDEEKPAPNTLTSSVVNTNDPNSVGPFSTSLGKLDNSDDDVDFQLPQDWHISSTYSPEKRAEVQAFEEEMDAQARLTEPEKDQTYVEETYAYMQRPDYDLDPDREPTQPKTVMPSSWQEYQFLQRQLDAFADAPAEDTGVSEEEREEARTLKEQLVEFYPAFKTILAEGWKLEYDPGVDSAGLLVARLRERQGGAARR